MLHFSAVISFKYIYHLVYVYYTNIYNMFIKFYTYGSVQVQNDVKLPLKIQPKQTFLKIRNCYWGEFLFLLNNSKLLCDKSMIILRYF